MAARSLADLTPRQREILALVAEGLGNAAIAQRLNISPRTVSTHLADAYWRIWEAPPESPRVAAALWLVRQQEGIWNALDEAEWRRLSAKRRGHLRRRAKALGM